MARKADYETVGVSLEKDGFLINIDKNEEKGKFVGTVSKVLEHIEIDEYSSEVLFSLIDKYFFDGKKSNWTIKPVI